MTTRNIYDLAQTWNNGATDFTAIKMNVTDTASAATSKLLDLQVGGVSRFTFDKGTGSVTRLSIFGMANGRQAIVEGGPQVKFGSATNHDVQLVRNTNVVATINASNQFIFSDTTTFGFTNVLFHRDAANTLALRNGVNAQAFNIYNTYTNASNYERGFMRWSSNILEIGTAGAGTGSNNRLIDFFVGSTRTLRLISSGPALYGTILSYGKIRGAGMYLEYPEVSGASVSAETNYAKVYAEDNGAGKTRLMVQFQTGAAQQIAIEP